MVDPEQLLVTSRSATKGGTAFTYHSERSNTRAFAAPERLRSRRRATHLQWSFHLLITGDKPFSTTNLTPKVTVTRLVLKGGRLADPRRETIIQYSKPN